MLPAGMTLKKLKELSSDPDAIVIFQDEVHFTVEATITRQWCARGSCPKVRSYPGRNSVAYSGFVVQKTGELFMTKPGWFNFETTIESIRAFIASFCPGKAEKVYLVMDNDPGTKRQNA